MFRSLESIIVRARDGVIDRRTAVAEAAQLSPKAAKAVDWALTLNLLTLLLAVIQFSYQFQQDRVRDTQEERKERTRFSYEQKRDAEQRELAENIFALMQETQHTQTEVLEAVKKLDLPAAEARTKRERKPKIANKFASEPGNRKERRAARSQRRRGLK
jgi:hypothetical protein